MSTDIPDFLRDNAHVPKQYDPKPTNVQNPKDAVGSKKLPLGLVPEVPEEALAFLEGALKYGRFNWRVAGVRASIYYDAMRRHQSKWWNGEDADLKTRVKHLLSVIACAKILLDAERCGKLTDDRPPRADMAKGIEDAEEIAAHLRELFKDHEPHQYTIADSAPVERQFAFELLDDEVPLTLDEIAAADAHMPGWIPPAGDHDEATALARLHERVRATEDSANGR